MNFAKVGKSPRLQKVLAVLKNGNVWRSTFEINAAARVTSAGTAIAEINRNDGYVIKKRLRGDGAAEYRLYSEPETTKTVPVSTQSTHAQHEQTSMFKTNAFGQAVNK